MEIQEENTINFFNSSLPISYLRPCMHYFSSANSWNNCINKIFQLNSEKENFINRNVFRRVPLTNWKKGIAWL